MSHDHDDMTSLIQTFASIPMTIDGYIFRDSEPELEPYLDLIRGYLRM